ncbi:MAG TPA: PQQ-binding-like beta-propeller repeat protein [Blastocatellia bacterium]|nr:PQQ-binding-like beta-propeller repeat protein [Blastocatellia bacterium]
MKIRARLSHTPSRPAVAASLWLLLIGCGLWLAPKALTASAPQEAVYTGEQAQRGRALYDQKCASCHGLQLEGTSASALAGPRFMSKWGQGNHTLDELYLLTRTQMPYGAGNTLTPQQYIEIIAYVLNANGYPAGARALPASPPALQQIKIVPQAMGKEQMTRPAPDSKPQATQAAGAPSTSSPTQQELSAAQANMNDWLHSNHDYAGQRYVDLKEITPQNVARLRPAGMYQVGDTRAFHNNPLVYRGVMYVTTTRSTIALNAANGKLRWRYDRNPKSIELHAPNRGAAIKDGRVVRTTTDGYLYALDMETGRPLWEKKIVPVEKNEGTFNGAPVIFENLVVIGLGISEQGVKGWVGAFKLDSGEPVWRFNTIPDDGEPGAETWGKPDAKLHGGGAVWAPMSLDSERGLLYIPVANPAPDFLDSVRPGANLYTSSMVVLDVRTGKRQWHYQLVPHDTHDWDATQASPLFTAKVNGKTRNLVAAGGKDGLLHVLDRDTREHLYETAVTTRQNTDAPLTPEGVHACPGVLGGMQWNGPAFNPQTNMLYVPSVDWCGTYKKDKEDEARLVPGQLYMGGSYVEDPIETAHGWLTAIDASTGKVAWQYRSSKPMLAAVTTTSTGLVFAGELTGDLLALDARTGKVLYRFNVGGPMNGGLISYAVNGKQYIAAMSGSASAFWKAVPGASTVVIFSLPDSRDLGR